MNLVAHKLLAFMMIIASLVVITLGTGGLKVSAFDFFGGTCKGDNTVQGGNGKKSPICTTNNSSKGDDNKNNTILRNISAGANIIAFLAGAAAVIMIIVGGFSYVTSGGNSEKTQNARRRIMNAAVGLAIVALAWAIARFVTGKIL